MGIVGHLYEKPNLAQPDLTPHSKYPPSQSPMGCVRLWVTLVEQKLSILASKLTRQVSKFIVWTNLYCLWLCRKDFLAEVPEGGDRNTWNELVDHVVDSLSDLDSEVSKMGIFSHSKFTTHHWSTHCETLQAALLTVPCLSVLTGVNACLLEIKFVLLLSLHSKDFTKLTSEDVMKVKEMEYTYPYITSSYKSGFGRSHFYWRE